MKKIAIFIFLISFFFAGCAIGTNGVLKRNIAELTYNSFEAEDTIFKVNFRSGKRENPYIGNGKAEGLVDFGVLTVFKHNPKMKETKIVFNLLINGETFDGDFETNPYDGSLVYDIKKNVDANPEIVVKLNYENKTNEFNLKNVLKQTDAMHEEILKIASNVLKAQIANFTVAGKLTAEVYVRIVISPLISKAKPMWYVSIFTESEETFAVVIEPTTREVLAKKA